MVVSFSAKHDKEIQWRKTWVSFTSLRPADWGWSSSKTSWPSYKLCCPFTVTMQTCVELSEALHHLFCPPHQFSQLFQQFQLSVWKASFSLCIGPSGSASRLRGHRLAQRQRFMATALPPQDSLCQYSLTITAPQRQDLPNQFLSWELLTSEKQFPQFLYVSSPTDPKNPFILFLLRNQ